MPWNASGSVKNAALSLALVLLAGCTELALKPMDDGGMTDMNPVISQPATGGQDAGGPDQVGATGGSGAITDDAGEPDKIDNPGECTDGDVASCDTGMLGACRLGQQMCEQGAWGACDVLTEPAAEVCEEGMFDEDCDGEYDEDCECVAGRVRDCGSSTVGACMQGSQVCLQDGTWGVCEGMVEPTGEACDAQGEDEDCDGEVNEGCECTPGDREPCGDSAVGACRFGERICDASGSWGACEGAVLPEAQDTCHNNIDDNCDGTVDEGCGCQAGMQRSCGDNTQGVCSAGVQTCDMGGQWGACVGAVLPSLEVCDAAAADEDCDGQANEGCTCVEGQVQPCGASSVGACMPGQQTCGLDGSWGTCSGGQGPSAEQCDAAGVDEDCDGQANEGCQCVVGTIEACGVSAVGACQLGQRVCDASGTWATCSGDVNPGTEQCDAAGVDEDCDGQANEGCECVAGTTESCGVSATGQCQLGQRSCSATGKWGACSGDVGPATEQCDASRLDEDCDGQTNEGCSCVNGQTRACGTSSVGACQMGTETCNLAGQWACVGAVDPVAEKCDANAVDEDCDGFANEGCPCTASSCGSGSVCSSSQCMPTNLVAQYLMDGDAKDSSGSGYHGVVEGPTLTSDWLGRSSRAYLFDGVDDVIHVDNAPNLDLGSRYGKFTVQAWIYPTEKKSQTIVVKGAAVNGTTAAPYGLSLSGTGDLIATMRGSSGTVQARKSGYSLNTWTHVAMTWDGSTVRLYENGAQVASAAFSGPANSNTLPLLIGTRTQSTGNTFHGKIDALQITSTVRSSSQLCSDAGLRGTAACP